MAAVSAEEAAELGKSLTPVGAERAGQHPGHHQRQPRKAPQRRHLHWRVVPGQLLEAAIHQREEADGKQHGNDAAEVGLGLHGDIVAGAGTGRGPKIGWVGKPWSNSRSRKKRMVDSWPRWGRGFR